MCAHTQTACSIEQWSPAFWATGITFIEESFSVDGGVDGFGMIQVHYIYCALSFYYYYISFT